MLDRCDGCRKSACDCGKHDPIVEILGFDAKVHYRRAANDPDVLEALSSPGYAVRGSVGAWMTIQEAVCESNHSFDIPLRIERGRFLAGPIGVSYDNQLDFWKRLFAENGCGVLVI
jgi:hypothetical protein